MARMTSAFTRILRTGAVVLSLAAGAAPFAAQAEPIDFYTVEGVSYDASVPTPDSFLGHGLGERPVRHDKMVDYLTMLAERSDRLSVETIGYTHEGRPILFLVATSPENHANLDEIRQAHLNRLGASNPTDTDTAPVITWINYGVHGAESSGMDAAIPTLYHLAAAQGDAIENTLDKAVILITAIFNPDGHSRRIDHVYRFSGTVPVTDPQHVHHDLWIEARTNHYWFDLNRQWLLQTQPESQAWLTKWHQWKPNVSADYHEMGGEATYYFHPGEPKRKNPLIPDRERELLTEISKFHARWLDSEAKLYFSEEVFDNFYIGKGSTYPSINGGVGILFEAGAARGGLIETQNGLRSYAENIRIHFRTSLTTIEGSLALREQLLTYQNRFFRQADELARDDQTKAYVFAAPGDEARLHHFTDLMRRHDVRVHELSGPVTVNGHTYRPGEAYVVPMDQRQYRMIRGLFDRVTSFEENIFYDVSGWTLPLAYDMTYAPLTRRDARVVGAPIDAPEFPVKAAPARAPYGYMFEWTGYYAPRALYRLLGKEVRARVSMKPVTVTTMDGPVDFNRGAIFVPLAKQDLAHDEILEIMGDIAAEDGIEVHAVTSGLTPTPGSDLGGRRSFHTLKKPAVLLLFDDGLRAYDVGEVWHLLDHRMRMPVTMQRKSELPRLDLSPYTHIILAGGNAGMDDTAKDRLTDWIRQDGGTLIAARGAAAWAQDEILKAEDDADGEEDGKEEETDEVKRFDYASLPLRDAEHVIGGTLFEGDLDITHPLGFGYLDRTVASLRNTSVVLDRPDNPFATVVQYTDSPLLSGYASEKRIGEIAGTPMAVAEREGAGTVILFTDNLNFRGTFFGTNKMFLNAIFFSGAIDSPGGEYEH